MHLADAFIQSDLHCIHVTVLHFISSCFPWEIVPKKAVLSILLSLGWNLTWYRTCSLPFPSDSHRIFHISSLSDVSSSDGSGHSERQKAASSAETEETSQAVVPAVSRCDLTHTDCTDTTVLILKCSCLFMLFLAKWQNYETDHSEVIITASAKHDECYIRDSSPKNSIIVYSPSCFSKPVWVSFLLFWGMWVTKEMLVPIDFHRMENKIVWKSVVVFSSKYHLL